MVVIKVNYTNDAPIIKVNYDDAPIYISTTVDATYISVDYGAGNGSAIWGQITGTLSDQTDLQNALDAKVPYTGATGNVDLGEYELKAGQLTLDTSPTGTASVGTTRWNDTIGSSETTLKGGSVILKNGVDLVARVVNKVTPNTTLTKAAYQAVRISGAQGQRLAVAFAQANNDNNSADTIGLVTETIATNQEGFIMTVGNLEDINTTGSLQGETWADGDVLYLSPTVAGAITNIKPVAPQHLVVIGYVEYAHANHGKIYVKVMNGWELGELHDVNTTGATTGQVLTYNGTIWTPQTNAAGNIYTIDGTLTGNRTVTMGSYSLSFQRDITINGAKFGVGGGNQNTNLAIGDSALPSNTTGYNNVAIGNSALFNNIGGVRNVGIGTYVLGDNTNGSYNTAIGDSIYGTTTGNYNTFIGQQIITGNVSNNIILGDGSGNMRLVFNSSGDAVLGGSTTYPTFSGFKLDVLGSGRYSGALTLSTIANATTDTDRFLVSDSGVIKYRTGAEILSDIGAIGGTLATGQVAYGSAANTIAGSNNLFWDNTNGRLGIGTNTPSYGLHIANKAAYIRPTNNSDDSLHISNQGFVVFRDVSDAIASRFRGLASAFQFHDASYNIKSIISVSNGLTYFNNGGGNVIIGGTTDSGQRLQVQGDAFIKGSGNTNATTALTVQNSDGTAMLRVVNRGEILIGSSGVVDIRPNNGTVGLPSLAGLGLTLNFGLSSGSGAGIIINNVNGNRTATSGLSNTLLVENGFAPTSGTGIFEFARLAGTINQTGGASGITRGLYVNPTLTAAADWRSIEWSNNSGWGLYGAGSAPNFVNGALGIGSLSLTSYALRIQKNISGGVVSFGASINSTIQSDVTSQAFAYHTNLNTQAAAFTLSNLYHFASLQGTIGATSTVTNQYGFFADATLIGATNNFGFYGNIPSGTNRWNLYMNGTANNYMAGSLGVGSTTLTGYNLRVSKNLTGSIGATGIESSGAVQSDVTSQAYYFISAASTQNATFTLANLAHYVADQGTFGASSTVQYQYGMRIRSTLVGATLGNYGIYGEIPSGTGRFNLYLSGTAANYLNGNTIIGGSAVDGGQKLQVNGDTLMKGSGNTTATSALLIQDSGSVNMFRFRNDGTFLLSAQLHSLRNTGTSFDIKSGNNTNGSDFIFTNANGARSYTSGTGEEVLIDLDFTPTSGTGVFSGLALVGAINQTGGANGITRGLYINPTLTSAADFRAIEVSAGTTVLAASVAARSSLRIPSGTAPTSPIDGDIWFDGTDLKMRIGGVTKTFTLV